MPVDLHSIAADALAEVNRKLVEQIVRPLGFDGSTQNSEAAEIFSSIVADVARHTEGWIEIQNGYYRAHFELWANFAAAGTAPVVRSVSAGNLDRRFRGEEWQVPYFNYLAQSYLLTARWIYQIVDNARLEPHRKKKAAFFVRQLVDAMSPANFPWSNPEALRLAAETNGESLAQGLKNLSADLERGMVSMTDESAFEVGRNLAVTPGAVVFENDFFQLIQYRPATDAVYERPLLMVPPCINKYYILDLQENNSFVRFAVEQGHSVFMLSWRNMPRSMGKATWDDYLEHGVVRAIETTREICAAAKIDVLGFCVGGTLLGSALAVLRAKGEDCVSSLTLLASMLDFRDTGELSVFIDEGYVRAREEDFADGGVLHGRELALAFASLRANELIWHYVVNNYLKGRTPEAFDFLYWNSDSTNLPGAMYVYYVRNMYLENKLREPGMLKMCGVPVDLGRIDMPAYLLATRDDHIVPWKTAYASTQLLRGPIEFVLAASGHIAGVINPASANRRNYWLNDHLDRDADQWLRSATSHPGSWWTHWSKWLGQQRDRRIPARAALGGGRYAEIEPAPGQYVKAKAANLT